MWSPQDAAPEPFDPEYLSAYQARSSFAGVPQRRWEAAEPGEVVILGAPFDWGASHRPEPASAPRPSARPTTWARMAAGRTSRPDWTRWWTCPWSTPATCP